MLLIHSEQHCIPGVQGNFPSMFQELLGKPHNFPFVFYCSKIHTIRKLNYLPNNFFLLTPTYTHFLMEFYCQAPLYFPPMSFQG